MRLVLGVALALPLAGCLSVGWTRESREVPLPEGALAQLQAGRTSLEQCLGVLGAPLAVWEHSEGGREGAVLAYGWSEGVNWGLNLSFPLTERASGSIDYDRFDRDLRGLVLFFDQDWILLRWRTGLLREASADLGHERRPVLLEDDR